MAVPPPPQLTEDDDGRAGSTVSAARGTRRARWKLAVAALPLLFAAALFLVNVFGGGGADVVSGEGSAVLSGEGDTSFGGGGDGGSDGGVTGAAGATAMVAAPDDIPVPAPVGATSAPVPPAGHRAVAVRFAAPDAVDLVSAGDRIDVVGLDGEVLAADLEVLQDRSTGQAGILVVAVPGDHAPELAAVAAAQDLTLLVAHTAG